MRSPSPIVVTPGAPLRRQVLPHIQRALHLVAGDVAGESEAQRVAVSLAVAARQLHAAAVDRAGEIARDEVSLMRAFHAIADLSEVQRVRRRAREIFDV